MPPAHTLYVLVILQYLPCKLARVLQNQNQELAPVHDGKCDERLKSDHQLTALIVKPTQYSSSRAWHYQCTPATGCETASCMTHL